MSTQGPITQGAAPRAPSARSRHRKSAAAGTRRHPASSVLATQSRKRAGNASAAASLNISVCIATHRRPQRLTVLLEDLTRQQLLPQEVVVVDNDVGASARSVVRQAVAAGVPFPIRYAMQQQKNISVTRNCSITLAQGDWLAFIDDDERAPPGWLQSLAQSARLFDADGVLGPVQPVLPSIAPAWLRRGSFYDWARMDTGTVVPLNLLRFGNVLLRRELLAAQQFDPAYGLTGGEDGDLLTRLVQRGAHVVWCDEAVVNEPIEAARMSLRWLLLRSLRGGQDFARHALAGRYGPVTVMRRVRLFLRALTQMLVAAGLALLVLPLGRHRSAQWLVKACANLGKLSAFLGWHYREYA